MQSITKMQEMQSRIWYHATLINLLFAIKSKSPSPAQSKKRIGFLHLKENKWQNDMWATYPTAEVASTAWIRGHM